LTPTSIRALLKHLLYIRETWVKAHLADDLIAITERARTAWAPRLRNGFTLMSTKKPSLKMYKKLKAKGSSLQKKLSRSSRDNKQFQKGKEERKPAKPVVDKVLENDDLDHTDEGVLYDGDCFFEAEESLIENSDDDDVGEPIPRKGSTTVFLLAYLSLLLLSLMMSMIIIFNFFSFLISFFSLW